MSGHTVPARTYYRVFAALLALTALTTAVAMVDLGPFNVVAALGIAFSKAILVTLFFMHVRYSGRIVALVVAAALFWLMILIVLTLNDYMTRQWLPAPKGFTASTR